VDRREAAEGGGGVGGDGGGTRAGQWEEPAAARGVVAGAVHGEREREGGTGAGRARVYGGGRNSGARGRVGSEAGAGGAAGSRRVNVGAKREAAPPRTGTEAEKERRVGLKQHDMSHLAFAPWFLPRWTPPLPRHVGCSAHVATFC
jgi:hypothetical protein